jgi:sugar phosphate isomerase/epimerase
MERRLSISTVAFDGYSLATALQEIADLGVNYVEPAYIQGYVDFDETAFGEANAAVVARALSDAGLSAFAVSAHVDTGQPVAVDQLKRRLDFAQRIGAEAVITMASTRTLQAQFFANMEQLVPFSEEAGMVIALENAGFGSDNLIATAADAAAVAKAIGSPCLRINYDFGNILVCSEEAIRPEPDFAEVLSWAVQFHVKDVQSLNDRYSFPAIGDGSINYRQILADLAASGDRTPLGLELPLRLSRFKGQSPQRAPDPLPLPVIRKALAESMTFMQTHMGTVRLTGG